MIGDSHLAMIVEAHKEKGTSACELSAVTWPREYEDEFTLDGTELVAGGRGLAEFWRGGGLPERIDVTRFDRIALVSHTVTAFNAFTVLREHAVSGWKGADGIAGALLAGDRTPNGRRLLTQKAFIECLVGIIKSNHAYRIAAHLRDHTDIPMTVSPPPFLAENTLKHRPKLFGLRRIVQNGDGIAFAGCYNAAHEVAFAPLENVTVLRQKGRTLTQGCLTKETYRAGAKRFGTDVAHNENDVMHAGPKLGQLVLDAVMRPPA